MYNTFNFKSFPVIAVVRYNGYKIAVRRYLSKTHHIRYIATNNIGEPYSEIPNFKNWKDAVRWDKENIDKYLSEDK